MRLPEASFRVLDWGGVEPTTHPGDTGHALWRTLEAAGVRMRIVDYSEGYLADHWCAKGHVLYVLSGELTTELKNGEVHRLRAGQGYYVGDDVMPHRSRTEGPVRLLIVD